LDKVLRANAHNRKQVSCALEMGARRMNKKGPEEGSTKKPFGAINMIIILIS
jgi:hypothetical protein